MNIQSEEISKKDAILKSVLELIRENGFHGVPMSQVARNAGVAAGTIYHYFTCKNEIISELCCQIKGEMATAMFNPIHADKPFRERFFIGWIGLCRYFIENPSALNFIEQFNSSPYAKAESITPKSSFGNQFNAFFQLGMDGGFVKPMEYTLIASIVFGCIITSAKFHLSGRHDYTDTELAKIASIIWDGIKTPETTG